MPPIGVSLTFRKFLVTEISIIMILALVFVTEYISILSIDALLRNLFQLALLFSLASCVVYAIYRIRPRDPAADPLSSKSEQKLRVSGWMIPAIKICSWTKVRKGNLHEVRKLRSFIADEFGISWVNGRDVINAYSKDNDTVSIRSADDAREVQLKLNAENKTDPNLSLRVLKESPETPSKAAFTRNDEDKNSADVAVSVASARGNEDLLLRAEASEIAVFETDQSASDENMVSDPLRKIDGCIPLKDLKGKALDRQIEWFEKSTETMPFRRDLGWWFKTRRLFADLLKVLQTRRYEIINQKDSSATTLGLNDYSGLHKEFRELDRYAENAIKTIILDHLASWACILTFIPLAFLSMDLSVYLLGSSQFNYFWFVAMWLVAAVFSVSLYPVLSYSIRKLQTATDIVRENFIASFTTTLVISVSFSILLGEALFSFPPGFYAQAATSVNQIVTNTVDKLIISLLATAVAVIFLRETVTLFLTRSSGALPILQDEMLLTTIQRIVMSYALIIASGVLIILFGIAPATDTTIIYLLLLSVITGAIGYASRETLENFFAGLILRVNPPFEPGDRVVISPNELCDVREIGMRTTRLYDVDSHTEIFYPNKQLVDQRIINVSRPDPELRVGITIHLPLEGLDLMKAEKVMMDVAFHNDEVEQSLVDRSDLEKVRDRQEIKEQLRKRVRVIIAEEVQSLQKRYPEIKSTGVKKLRDIEVSIETFDAEASEAFRLLKKAQEVWKQGEDHHFDSIENRLNGLGRLSMAVFELSDQHEELKEKLEPLIAEISREPLVHSEFETDSVKLTLFVFVLHLERRKQVEENLNREVLASFQRNQLLLAKVPDSALDNTKLSQSETKKPEKHPPKEEHLSIAA